MSYMYVGSRYPPQLAKRITWLEKEAGKASVFKKGGKLATPFNCLTITTKKMGENTFQLSTTVASSYCQPATASYLPSLQLAKLPVRPAGTGT